MDTDPLGVQRGFWNKWNQTREARIGDVPRDQADLIEIWLSGRTGLEILDVGCGTGWLCIRLLKFGRVTGTDLADEIIERAQKRLPQVQFIAGDFMALHIEGGFDVITSLEVLSHVADQPAFIGKLASLLKPGGELLLATQNRFVLERNDIPPPGHGQIRKWVDRVELKRLLTPHFKILEITTRTPMGDRGIMRIVSSHKLNAIADSLFGHQRTKRMQERLGFGWTLMVRAQVR